MGLSTASPPQSNVILLICQLSFAIQAMRLIPYTDIQYHECSKINDESDQQIMSLNWWKFDKTYFAYLNLFFNVMI